MDLSAVITLKSYFFIIARRYLKTILEKKIIEVLVMERIKSDAVAGIIIKMMKLLILLSFSVTKFNATGNNFCKIRSESDIFLKWK